MNCDINSKLFKNLKGRWAVERQVIPGGTFRGQAEFFPASEYVLLYRESGILTLDDGTALEPTKKYQWRLEQGVISIYFDDGVTKGQLFQTLDSISPNSATAYHFCYPDDYASQYTFQMPDQFEISHDVSGPKKSYKTQSIYRHLSA